MIKGGKGSFCSSEIKGKVCGEVMEEFRILDSTYHSLAYIFIIVDYKSTDTFKPHKIVLIFILYHYHRFK
jgi:hypothetical protein